MSFLKISKKYSTKETSQVAILGVPYEKTTSYVKGCASGPKAIVQASHYVELFDDEFHVIPHRLGIYTHMMKNFSISHEENLRRIGNTYKNLYQEGKFVIALGGEHSITYGIVNELLRTAPSLSIVHFDAHADLRSYYQGSKLSHACVMRRIYEKTDRIAHLGVRSFSSEEYSFMRKTDPNIIYGSDLQQTPLDDIFQQLSRTLNDDIYITFDVDFFSSDIIPSTGTPEPGGIGWYKTLHILRVLFERYNVVGMDIVELIGNEHDKVSPFNAALLAKKCITYKHFAKKKELTNDLYMLKS